MNLSCPSNPHRFSWAGKKVEAAVEEQGGGGGDDDDTSESQLTSDKVLQMLPDNSRIKNLILEHPQNR